MGCAIMAFTVSDLHDLISLLEQKPEWKVELRKVLLGDELLQMPAMLRELIELVHGVIERQDRMEKRLDSMEKRQDRMEQRQDRMEQRQDRMEQRQDRMERDLAELKGSDRERYYRERASAIFGRWLRKGRDATDFIVEKLHEAVKAGRITPEEQDEVLNADLLWSGEYEGKEVVIVGEVSWSVEDEDVRRAARRAGILRRLDMRAIAVAGGRIWSEQVKRLAMEMDVIICQNGVIERQLMERLLSQA